MRGMGGFSGDGDFYASVVLPVLFSKFFPVSLRELEEYCLTHNNYVFHSYKKIVLNGKLLFDILSSLLKNCLQNSSLTTCCLWLAMLVVADHCWLSFPL